MKQILVDTDVLSLFFRNHLKVVKTFKNYLRMFDKIHFSIITYYEIYSGLKYKDARKQLSSFLEFAKLNSILPITEQSVEVSAEIYMNLRRKGILIDDIDILIAGIAISNNLKLATHNRKHFERVENLEIVVWS
ncbi:MAG: type II toxin-antitoxin system VapC family toxin [bacterium]|nr:type II toxin-antitoxin system VapC family toxin [bacterium]